MAVTKSTLNSKLPGVSKIAFCSSAGKDMYRTIFTGENGKFSTKVGFRQSATTFPYQVQYRSRSRYTKANAKVKGATWTKWGSWRNAVAVSGIAKDATESSNPVNKWLKANKGVNRTSKYLTFYTFSSYQIAEAYDARQFEFRVRTFNKAKAKHGSWTSQVLSVYRRAAVRDETYYAGAQGGLICDFNYAWDRSYSIQVNSVRDAAGRELLTKSFKTTANTDGQRSAVTVPAIRDGYIPGTVEVPLSKLKREVAAGEDLTVDIRFVTEDKGATAFESHRVLDSEPAISPMTITPTWDEVTGVLTVLVAKGDPDDVIDQLGCSVSYTYRGKAYSIEPVASHIDLASASCGSFTFFPPLGTALTVKAKASTYRSVRTDEAATSLSAPGYRLNSHADAGLCALAWAGAGIDVKSSASVETALPFGRKKQIAFYGDGTSTSVTLSAKVLEVADQYGGAFASREGWDRMAEAQGICTLRTPRGGMYRVAVQSVSLTRDDAGIYSLSVSAQEVV